MSQASNIPFTFGSFDYLCNQVALPVCALLGPNGGVEPNCYARPLELLAMKSIFEPAVLLVYIVALLMTFLMIIHVRNKYTGVGRKEMTPFFYFYAAAVVVDFFLVSGLIDVTAGYYKFFVAAQIGLTLATVWAMFVNSLVGFQWLEDGILISVMLVWITSAIAGAGGFVISLFTFQNTAGLSASKPNVLFFIYVVGTLALITFYFLISVILVLTSLRDKWPIFDLLVGLTFFGGGQVIQYLLATRICEQFGHYVDGMLFGSIATLLSVMMVYKFWDDITKEDFEFSVNNSISNWEVKEPLLGAPDLESNKY
ncbi:Chitin synthase, class 7 [Phlyctochytrium planicorne]|nr:Chitin synthase, class 7 [Phlyctochytrium planicorne]